MSSSWRDYRVILKVDNNLHFDLLLWESQLLFRWVAESLYSKKSGNFHKFQRPREAQRILLLPKLKEP